jgi:excisionase family DNA binding protein
MGISNPNLNLSVVERQFLGSNSGPGPLGVSPRQACLMLGCGNTLLYELIKNGEISSYRLGRTRKILVSSIQELVQRQMIV